MFHLITVVKIKKKRQKININNKFYLRTLILKIRLLIK